MKSLLVAVTGATGAQGGATARALLQRGHRVRALTRRPETAEALRTSGADIVTADFDSPTSLDAAFEDVDAVFLMTTPFGADLDTEVRQGIDAVDAAVRAEVGHIVFTSAANADRDTGIPHFDSKYVIEQHLAKATTDWTVLGPAAFMDNYLGHWVADSLRRGKFPLPLQPGVALKLISAADIGRFAALVVDRHDEFIGRRVDIASDELTGEQLAGELARATGRPVEFEPVPLEQARGYSEDLRTMFRWFNEVGLDVDIPHLRDAYPEVGWQRFAQWAAEQTWP
jgi:uncharacterized protein YbjT (DUF2867 family)